MWKRRSTASVKEVPAQSATLSGLALTTGATRVYNFTQLPNRRQFKVQEKSSPNIIYTLTFTAIPKPWGMLLSEGGPELTTREDVTVVGAANIDHKCPIIELAFGNALIKTDIYERLELNQESMYPTKRFNLTFPLPPLASEEGETRSRSLELQWKSTNKAKGFGKAVDRGMHHKLIEKSSNTLLARYTHDDLWNPDVGGTVEIFADVTGFVPEQWERFVLVSALAVTEKTLKWAHAKMGVDPHAQYAVAAAAVGIGVGAAGVHETAENIEAIAEAVEATAFIG